jgi:hypothetical protein
MRGLDVRRALTPTLLALAAAFWGGLWLPQARGRTELQTLDSAGPEARAIAYLAIEVPKWRREHPCYSCHNNGDAARALIAARRAGIDTSDALADTLEWLRTPAQWEHNAGRGDASDDRILARIQFAGALAAALDGNLAPRDALAEAASDLARDQHADGSWRLDSSESLGSPATYGLALATSSARSTLHQAHDPRFASALARADGWLRTLDVKTVLDSSAVVLGLERATDEAALNQRRKSLALIKNGEAPGGGWGPYVTSAPEPFDTALAVLALQSLMDRPALASPILEATELGDAVRRGRRFLIERQLSDGSWPETTRPSGQESYAQRISTAGWAAQALLASRTMP